MISTSTWPDSPIALKGDWALSTSHASSSLGIPVLVAPTGEGYGPGDYLTVIQVAQLRGIDPATIRQRIARNATVAKKLGRDWIIAASDAVKP